MSYSLACAVGATKRLLWMSEGQAGAGRAPVTGMDLTALVARNTQAPHKRSDAGLGSQSAQDSQQPEEQSQMDQRQ